MRPAAIYMVNCRERASITIAETALLLVFVVIIVWLTIKPFSKAAINAQNSDREVLEQYQVLNLMPSQTPTP